MIPRTLTDWSESVVVDLLKKGFFETDNFDYKKLLPPKEDKAGNWSVSGAGSAAVPTLIITQTGWPS